MMCKNFVSIIFVISVLFGIGQCFLETTKKNEYMVCKPVAGVFGSLSDGKNGSQGLMPVLQGPEGAPGPPGKTGVPGPKGQPDYTKVAKMVEDKLHSINARLYTVETDINNYKRGTVPSPGGPTTTPSPVDKNYENQCQKLYGTPMHIGAICYKIMGGEGLLMTFDVAKSDCEKSGGFMSDLNSKDSYDMIYDYIDKTYSTVVQAWTGMRYENETLFLRDGKEAAYAKWSSGYPRKGSSYYKNYNYVYIYVDSSAYVRKLSNTASRTKEPYGICSYDLNKVQNGTATTTTTAP